MGGEVASVTRLSLSYLNDPREAEALAFGYGLPPPHIIAELRALWWRFRAQGLSLPVERRVILLGGGRA